MTKRTITPEIRAQLLGVLPLSDSHGITFVPGGFHTKELKCFAPEFKQRGWTEKENLEYLNTPSMSESDMLEITRHTILDMPKPVIDLGSGDEYVFVKDENLNCISKAVWSKIPINMRLALYNNAKKISGLNTVEKESLE